MRPVSSQRLPPPSEVSTVPEREVTAPKPARAPERPPLFQPPEPLVDVDPDAAVWDALRRHRLH
ncbi:MAG: hypothetical protein KIT84_01630 [Labilithrix sp.]|nr:hypothetical protein [Labilithrix sp.]MCW5809687.1 hypothetical protein [Labilithrix sp.]